MALRALRALCAVAAGAALVSSAETSASVSVDADGSISPSPSPSATPRPCRSRASVLSKAPVLQASGILASHDKYCDDTHRKAFKGETLAYVTPWNRRGYDVARDFAGKFTYVSPVWFQVQVDKGTREGTVQGKHEINLEWMDSVRSVCERTNESSCPLIVPRVSWEIGELPGSEWTRVVGEAIKDILKTLDDYEFDGVVFEGPRGNEDKLVKTIRALSKALRAAPRGGPYAKPDERMVFIYVAAPPVIHNGKHITGMTPSFFRSLLPLVDRFSLMTYDFSVHRGDMQGPNAPIGWMAETALQVVSETAEGPERADALSRVLLGQPFYGYDNAEPIVAWKMVELLQERKPKLRWDADHAEHSFTYSKVHEADGSGPGSSGKKVRHTVHYPTLGSVAARVDLAENFGTGISIWEIGQGMDSWMDLL
jgi:chitinase domain-containing protein 1